jgi:hypothetical protein
MVVLAVAGPSVLDEMALHDSLSRVHPRMRASWLREHGLDDSYYTTFHRPESTGLSCLGRWPWGPSWELAGRDTFLYLGSGSGVRILSIADSVQPRMLGQINARGLVSQVVVEDTLLFVACGSWGAQIYSVSDPANPRELGSMDAVIGDLCVKDTFCYTVGSDSFRIYNVASPTQPAQLSAIRDSGDVLVEANGYAYVGCGASGTALNVYDVRNPHSPTLVNTLGGVQLALFVRGNLLFRTSVQPSYFSILDISNPSSIHEVGRIDGYGGMALYADDKYAYLSCMYDHSGLFVIDISDSSHPQLRDSINPVGVTEWDPYVPHSPGYGYLADDYGGLVVVDVHDVNNLSEAWSGYRADQSVDIAVDNGRAYVADHWVGTEIIDVTDPTRPVSLGVYDTSDSRGTNTVMARDSFAFAGMSGVAGRRSLRVLDVSAPSHPTLVAEDSCYSWPEDMVLRDSLLYAAEMNWFQVFNVARPRQPVLVGSCVTNTYATNLELVDTFAYISGSPLNVINVARPDSPFVGGEFYFGVSGLDVVDTVMYAVGQNAQFWAVSVANPTAPRLLDSLRLPSYDAADVVVVGSIAYACENVIRLVDVSDPTHLVLRGSAGVPYATWRLKYAAPYVYACCEDGGVCVLETIPVGVSERYEGRLRDKALSVCPTITRGPLVLEVAMPLASAKLSVYDVAGKEVLRLQAPAKRSGLTGRWPVDLSRLSAGVYVLRLDVNGVTEVGKVIITRR